MWLVHAGSPRPSADRRVELGQRVVVDVPERDEAALVRVVEDVAGPTAFHRLAGDDLHQVEAHDLGVEAVRGVEVVGRDGNVVEAHAHQGTVPA